MIVMEALSVRRDLMLAGVDTSGNTGAGPTLNYAWLRAHVRLWLMGSYHRIKTIWIVKRLLQFGLNGLIRVKE